MKNSLLHVHGQVFCCAGWPLGVLCTNADTEFVTLFVRSLCSVLYCQRLHFRTQAADLQVRRANMAGCHADFTSTNSRTANVSTLSTCVRSPTPCENVGALFV